MFFKDKVIDKLSESESEESSESRSNKIYPKSVVEPENNNIFPYEKVSEHLNAIENILKSVGSGNVLKVMDLRDDLLSGFKNIFC